MTANSNLAKNLKFLMNKHGLTANGLQGKTGITQSTTSRILNGNTKNPRDNLLQQYVDFFGVDLSDLRYKDLAKTQETSNKPTPDLKSNISIDFMAVDDWDDDTPLDDEVAVPFYKDFSFACGQGKEGITMTSEWRKLRISRATIDRIGAYKDRIFATLADGNSMSPTINDGDTIWVDMSKESIKSTAELNTTKIQAELLKLIAETQKLQKETKYYPAVSIVIAIIALMASTIALLK